MCADCPDNVNQYQFHVVAPGYKPKKNGATGSRTEADQKANESPGKVIAVHPEHGIVGALTYSHKEWTKGGQGRGVDVALVDPRHGGTGMADAMYNIGSREMGYKLGHSGSLTDKGAKFANRVGGPTNTGREPRASLRPIPVGAGDLNTSMLQGDIKHNSTPIDPVISNALTPVREPKPQRATPQKTLPGEDWKQYKTPKAAKAQTVGQRRAARAKK